MLSTAECRSIDSFGIDITSPQGRGLSRSELCSTTCGSAIPLVTDYRRSLSFVIGNLLYVPRQLMPPKCRADTAEHVTYFPSVYCYDFVRSSSPHRIVCTGTSRMKVKASAKEIDHVRCRYCVEGETFLSMVAHRDGRYICNRCGTSNFRTWGSSATAGTASRSGRLECRVTKKTEYSFEGVSENDINVRYGTVRRSISKPYAKCVVKKAQKLAS